MKKSKQKKNSKHQQKTVYASRPHSNSQEARLTNPGASEEALQVMATQTPGNKEPRSATADSELILQFTGDVLDKRYNIYGWCETKVNNLIALNGLLLAAIFVVVGFSSKRPIDNFCALTQNMSTAGAILFLCVSLFKALAHIRPKMNSGTGTGMNPRSVIGTIRHKNWAAFEKQVRGLSVDKMISCNIEQIYGMSSNIMRNDRAIRSAAMFSVLGLICFLLAIILTFYENIQ